MLTRLTQNFYLFQNGEYLVACHRDEAISNIKIKNTKGLAPLDSLLLCLIHPSLFSFRLSFPYLPLSFPHPSLVIPAQAGIQIQLDPQSEALRFRLRMTGGAGSRIKCGMTKRNVDPQSEALRFRLRMTPGLSVEDDGRLSVKDDTRAFGWG